MRKLIFILLIFPLLSNAQQESSLGWLFVNENTIPLDKQMHGAGGMYLGGVSYIVTYGGTKDRKKSKIVGILTPIIVGTIKELSDSTKSNNKFDWADLGYTVGGGIVATYTFDFLVGRANKRKNKRGKSI